MTQQISPARGSSLSGGPRVFAVRCLCLAALLFGAPPVRAQFPPAPAPAPASRPVRPPALPDSAVDIAHGVWIDWAQSEVYLAARALRRESVLEFAASLPGKHHESLVALEAGGADIFAALGLSGLNPGRPPLWDERSQRFISATGDLLDVHFAWEAEGRVMRASPFDWMIELEYQRRPRARPWIFAGSVLRPGGRLGCDVSGAAFALVDFPDSLVCLPGSHTSSNEEIWIDADVAVTPPAGTPVTLVVRPAVARVPRVEIDFRGVARIDGRVESPDDVVDVVRMMQLQDHESALTIVTSGLMASDVERWRVRFRQAGLPDAAWRLEPRGTADWLRIGVESAP